MRTQTKHVILGATLVLCLVSVLVGWLACNPWPAAGGGLGLCYLALRAAYFGREEKRAAH
ncbi:MAG: hypothetical protein ACYSWU_10300 [Planctomycetota bacterium]|jgi:hypothetical protein